jgi:DNA-binding MarR family transcriptional regulator
VTQAITEGSQTLVQTWRELARNFTRISCRLDKDLHERHRLCMSDFEILDRLVEARVALIRMQELGEEVHLSQSALSRAVARLEKDGLVERCVCSDDRRGVFVCITPAGQERWEAASVTHREILAEMLL